MLRIIPRSAASLKGIILCLYHATISFLRYYDKALDSSQQLSLLKQQPLVKQDACTSHTCNKTLFVKWPPVSTSDIL